MIKSRFDVQGLSVRLGIAFSRLGISPNAWTIFALVPGVGFCFIVLWEHSSWPYFFHSLWVY